MRVTDIHCHIYPDAIALKAAENVGAFYGVTMKSPGSVGELLRLSARAGISRHVVHAVALREKSVISINDFIAEQCQLHPEFVGFATMHHDFVNKSGEIERIVAAGLKGFKLHPDSQQVNADDPRLMEFYEMIAGRLPLMLHCGDYRYDYSHPRRIKRILQTFPNLVLNAAHFGGWMSYDLAVDFLADENCYMDVSSASGWLGQRRTTELINFYGAERILFGSDFPMWDPSEEFDRFMLNDLSDEQRELILWQNAERYLANERPQSR